jgi:hypothetical protein
VRNPKHAGQVGASDCVIDRRLFCAGCGTTDRAPAPARPGRPRCECWPRSWNRSSG